MAAQIQGIDYYLVNGPCNILVLFIEGLRRITFVLLNPLMVFGGNVPGVDEIVEVNKGHAGEDAEDRGDPDLVGDNKQ